MIARHLAEWNEQNVVNESNDLAEHTQRSMMYERLGTRETEKLIETSAYHKLSSFLFTFRLVCKEWAAVGLKVFLDCAKTERYAHYTILHLPPPPQMSITKLTGMLLRQPSISEQITELLIHVISDYVPQVPHYQSSFKWHGVKSRELALSLCNDAVRMFRTYNNESLFCGHLFPPSGPSDPLQQLICNIRTIRSVQIQYDDFWYGHHMSKYQPQIPHFQILPISRQDITFDLLSRLWRASLGNKCSTLKLTAIGTDFLRFLDKFHDRSTVKAAARTTNLEICLVARDDFHGIRGPGLPDIGPPVGERALTFLEGFPNLVSLTFDFNANPDELVLDPECAYKDLIHFSQHWIEKSFDAQHWPQLQSLVLRRQMMNADILVSFLRWHRDTLRHVELGYIFFGPDFVDNQFLDYSKEWSCVLLALQCDLSLSSVRIAFGEWLPDWFAEPISDPTFPDLSMPDEVEYGVSGDWPRHVRAYREVERKVENWVLRRPQPF